MTQVAPSRAKTRHQDINRLSAIRVSYEKVRAANADFWAIHVLLTIPVALASPESTSAAAPGCLATPVKSSLVAWSSGGKLCRCGERSSRDSFFFRVSSHSRSVGRGSWERVFKALREPSEDQKLCRCRPWSSLVSTFDLSPWARALIGRKMNHSTMFLSSQGRRIV